MPTERNAKSNSTSPNINANEHTLYNRQRVSSSSTTYPLGISFLSTSASLNERYIKSNKQIFGVINNL